MDMLQHLRDRWFDPSRYRGVWIEPDVSVTVAMWNTSGQMVGYQKYQPDAPRVHTNGLDTRYHSWFGDHKVGVWGMETVVWDSGPLFLTEGIFDCCRLHWHGLPAVAVIASDPKHLRSWFRCLPQQLIAVCDGDNAGRKLAKYGHTVLQMPAGHDVGSLDEYEFLNFFAPYIMPHRVLLPYKVLLYRKWQILEWLVENFGAEFTCWRRGRLCGFEGLHIEFADPEHALLFRLRWC